MTCQVSWRHVIINDSNTEETNLKSVCFLDIVGVSVERRKCESYGFNRLVILGDVMIILKRKSRLGIIARGRVQWLADIIAVTKFPVP